MLHPDLFMLIAHIALTHYSSFTGWGRLFEREPPSCVNYSKAWPLDCAPVCPVIEMCVFAFVQQMALSA